MRTLAIGVLVVLLGCADGNPAATGAGGGSGGGATAGTQGSAGAGGDGSQGGGAGTAGATGGTGAPAGGASGGAMAGASGGRGGSTGQAGAAGSGGTLTCQSIGWSPQAAGTCSNAAGTGVARKNGVVCWICLTPTAPNPNATPDCMATTTDPQATVLCVQNCGTCS